MDEPDDVRNDVWGDFLAVFANVWAEFGRVARFALVAMMALSVYDLIGAWRGQIG
ncbi:MAG: hypothetical protein AAF957_27320 [Planctomycetota bacterium]